MSRTHQNTLAGEVVFEGMALHCGQEVRAVCRPAPAGSGYSFRRADQEGSRPFRATFDRLDDAALQRQTSLADDRGARVATVEHLVSACVGLGIDNVQVDVFGEEIPLLDGSANPFARAFAEAGIEPLDAPRGGVSLAEPFSYCEGDAEITYVPGDTYRATFFADYNSDVVGVQAAHYTEETDYLAEIAPARTFVMLEDLEKLRAANLIKGGSLDNALVITPTEYLNGPLRFDDEIARHKLLDLLGDLALLGSPLRGHVLAYKSGHRSNVHFVREFARRLAS